MKYRELLIKIIKWLKEKRFIKCRHKFLLAYKWKLDKTFRCTECKKEITDKFNFPEKKTINTTL